MLFVRTVSPALTLAVLSASQGAFAIDIPTLRLDTGIRVLSIHRNTSLAFPVTSSVPISGFEPKVALTLTDKQASDQFLWSAQPASAKTGNYLPSGGFTTMATLDSGGQSHVISAVDEVNFGISNSNRRGGATADIVGASGAETTDVSDPLGVFIAGISNVTAGPTASVPESSLKGQYNVSVLTARTGSSIPNIVGLPLIAQYGISIKNSKTFHKTIGATTYRGPEITLENQNPAVNTGPITGLKHKASLDLLDPQGSALADPSFIPDISGFGNYLNDPTTPTFWSFPFADVNVSHTDGARVGQQFLFDTGAQVTVLSEQMAANIGFDVVDDVPDFTVDVAGVGGATTAVPGFYLQSITVNAVGGALTLNNVPVLLLNVTDPRDGVGFVPGIVGMNLFNDRDLFLNLDTADPYVRWSDPIAAKWNVNAAGNWSNDNNWQLGMPDAIDAPANFTSAITAAKTITVDQSVTVGSMSFDNAAKYTVQGPGTITIDATVTGAITDTNGSHDITAAVVLNKDTLVTVTNAVDTLKLTQLQATTHNVTKTGAGTLEVNAVRSAGLSINAGRVSITPNGGAASVSVVKSLSITGTGKLDLRDNDLVIDYTGGSSPYANILAMVKTGITSLGGSGIGIASSEINAGSPGKMLAVVDDLGAITTLSGFAIASPGSSVIVKYTWVGDANIDGVVDGTDYALIDSGFAGTGNTWNKGDFNYSGNVDGTDYALIDTGFGQQSGALPEPGLLSFIGIGGLFLKRRRI